MTSVHINIFLLNLLELPLATSALQKQVQSKCEEISRKVHRRQKHYACVYQANQPPAHTSPKRSFSAMLCAWRCMPMQTRVKVCTLAHLSVSICTVLRVFPCTSMHACMHVHWPCHLGPLSAEPAKFLNQQASYMHHSQKTNIVDGGLYNSSAFSWSRWCIVYVHLYMCYDQTTYII
jgi:hypothetical protein